MMLKYVRQIAIFYSAENLVGVLDYCENFNRK